MFFFRSCFNAFVVFTVAYADIAEMNDALIIGVLVDIGADRFQRSKEKGGEHHGEYRFTAHRKPRTKNKGKAELYLVLDITIKRDFVNESFMFYGVDAGAGVVRRRRILRYSSHQRNCETIAENLYRHDFILWYNSDDRDKNSGTAGDKSGEYPLREKISDLHVMLVRMRRGI